MTTPHRLCVAPMMDWTDFMGQAAVAAHRGTLRIEPATPRFAGDSGQYVVPYNQLLAVLADSPH